MLRCLINLLTLLFLGIALPSAATALTGGDTASSGSIRLHFAEAPKLYTQSLSLMKPNSPRAYDDTSDDHFKDQENKAIILMAVGTAVCLMGVALLNNKGKGDWFMKPETPGNLFLFIGISLAALGGIVFVHNRYRNSQAKRQVY